MDIKAVKENTIGLSLLYVEDDTDLREKTVKILSNLFGQVDQAEDGASGLESYENHKEKNGKYYDLVVTDINMPQMNGVEMSRKMIDLCPTQTVIIISAHNETEYLHQAIDIGVFGFITKPIEYNRFLQVADRAARNIVNSRLKEMRIEQERMHSIQQMLKSIAHHWRQPLNMISILSDLMLENIHEDVIDPQEIAGSLEKIKATTLQLSSTINSFRVMFKNGEYLETFELDSVFESVSSIIAPELEGEQIRYESSFEIMTLRGFKNDLIRTLISIIHNGKESIQKRKEQLPDHEGFIEIKAFPQGDEVVIRVSDNGVGMAEEIAKQVFEPYYTTKFQSIGVGISLYYAKCVIEEQMHGRLGVETSEGNGAVFEIRVPITLEG